MGMNENATQPIVVKRIKKGGGGHHGAAWKIAYADFVTAMMAFFLLMWLIGSTAKGDLEGIAEYFQTPLKVAMQGGVGSGDASHVVSGGGQDLTRTAGQLKRGDVEAEKRSINLQALEAEREKAEAERLGELKEQISRKIEASPQLRPYRDQLLLDMTSEGLRVQIVDTQNRPMFDLSSAELKPYALDILRQIGSVLDGTDNRVSLSGHTDATPYASGEKGFSNWELSANRANASRRALISGGLDEAKIVRIVGLGSTVMLNRDDPLHPVNRRISIIVLKKKTEEGLLRDAATVETDPDALVGEAASAAAKAASR